MRLRRVAECLALMAFSAFTYYAIILTFYVALWLVGGSYRLSVSSSLAGRCYGHVSTRVAYLRCYPLPTETP